MELDLVAFWVGGAFAFLATLLTFYQIRLHLIYNSSANMRRYVIRILLMVPVYCLDSWLGLRFSDEYIYFDSLRDCYEALVIYSFFQLMVEYMGGEQEIVSVLRGLQSRAHMFPFCFWSDWQMGHSFFHYCRIGILQYVFVKPLTAFITFILVACNVYGDGLIRADRGYVYMAFILNCSQCWALYCLVLFYMGTREVLKPMRPIPKFLCVKMVVFATFWQSVFIAILVEVGAITPYGSYTPENVATSLQDFIICIEMLFAAIAHKFAFGHLDFHDPENHTHAQPMMRSLMQAANLSDVGSHINTHIIPDKTTIVALPKKAAKKVAKLIPNATKRNRYGRIRTGSSPNQSPLLADQDALEPLDDGFNVAALELGQMPTRHSFANSESPSPLDHDDDRKALLSQSVGVVACDHDQEEA